MVVHNPKYITLQAGKYWEQSGFPSRGLILNRRNRDLKSKRCLWKTWNDLLKRHTVKLKGGHSTLSNWPKWKTQYPY